LMTGPEMRAARERLGVSRAELAARGGVGDDDLERWEAASVPRSAGFRLDRALWELERAAALAESGLTPCPWVAQFAAQPGGPRKDPWTLERHIAQCSVCQARGRFLEKRLRPRPPHPAWAWLPAVVRAALVGAMWALGASGAIIAVAILVVLGAVAGDVSLFGAGAGVLAAVGLGGMAGGAVYCWAAPLRKRGFRGRILRWILALEALLFVAAGTVAVAASWQVPGFGSEAWALVANPWVLAGLAAVGAVGGIAAAAAPRDA
jgi:hypothetical protein